MVKRIQNIQITEEDPKGKGIAWWLENTLVRVVKRVINGVSTPLRQILSFSLSDFMDDIETELLPMIRPLIEQVLLVPGLPSYVRSPLEKALQAQAPAGVIIIGACVGMLVAIVSRGIIDPVGRSLEHQGERIFRSHLVDPGSAVLMKHRGMIDQGTYDTLMAMNGVPNEAITWYSELGKPLLDDSTLTQLMWRGEITDFSVTTELKKRGYSDQLIEQWKQVREVIPSPNELISIAVREGFNDRVAQQFGYDEDFPVIAAAYAKMQGMDTKFFKAAWRAHWNLPGLVQVREMYHRDIVTEEDLRVYLKAADLPIFWRDAIIKWMDRVVTRVDARRMYDLGIWDEARVFAHHKELGYNDDDAGDMTMWVALNYMSDDRDLTKSDVLTMYQDGILNEFEATSYLEALDYKPSAIALMIAHRDLKRDEQYERQIISNVKALFIGGLYDRTDVFAKLGKIATPDAVIKQNLAVWDLEKERKVMVPTTTQLRDMVLEGVITVDTFIVEMRNKKYPDKYINWYIGLWLKEE